MLIQLRDPNDLKRIFDRTDGKCHLCHEKLFFASYGSKGGSRAWHIEHSVPKARGGTDHLNNLYPACASCNCKKGTKSTRTVRRRNGHSRAPLSKQKRIQKQQQNTLAAGTAAALVGAAFGGPVGAFLLGGIGALVGFDAASK